MKIQRKHLLLAFVLLVVGSWMLKGTIFRGLVTYQTIERRASPDKRNPEISDWVHQNVQPTALEDPSTILEEAQRLTAMRLRFTTKPCPSDALGAFRSEKANCIGYAALCAEICNQLFAERKMDDQFHAEPAVVHLYLLGMNVHALFSDPFFRDHDFVRIQDHLQGTVARVDPAVYDYLGIARVNGE